MRRRVWCTLFLGRASDVATTWLLKRRVGVFQQHRVWTHETCLVGRDLGQRRLSAWVKGVSSLEHKPIISSFPTFKPKS